MSVAPLPSTLSWNAWLLNPSRDAQKRRWLSLRPDAPVNSRSFSTCLTLSLRFRDTSIGRAFAPAMSPVTIPLTSCSSSHSPMATKRSLLVSFRCTRSAAASFLSRSVSSSSWNTHTSSAVNWGVPASQDGEANSPAESGSSKVLPNAHRLLEGWSMSIYRSGPRPKHGPPERCTPFTSWSTFECLTAYSGHLWMSHRTGISLNFGSSFFVSFPSGTPLLREKTNALGSGWKPPTFDHGRLLKAPNKCVANVPSPPCLGDEAAVTKRRFFLPSQKRWKLLVPHPCLAVRKTMSFTTSLMPERSSIEWRSSGSKTMVVERCRGVLCPLLGFAERLLLIEEPGGEASSLSDARLMMAETLAASDLSYTLDCSTLRAT
mmetsp:Transcript_45947/g.111916  ORF Transcript_45947/g.111916 Transcript_45947/m.111916 type:complete len:375 (-) Transcript_45947:57-1181(-)